MINTILSSITGAFSKDFLYASFLPALLMMIAVGAPFAAAVGWIPVITHFEQLTAGQMAMTSTALTLITVLTAYMLSGLRGAFINFWSGDSRLLLWIPHAFVRFGESRQRRRFVRLRERSRRKPQWSTTLREFQDLARAYWKLPNRKQATDEERAAILREAKTLTEAATPEAVKGLAEHFRLYDNVQPLFAIVKRTLLDWDDMERLQLQKDAARLDREFGSFSTVRATRLGNIIASYNHYAHKRYRIETEVFWPRLLKVIPESYYNAVQEPKIVLDFATTMASISLVYGFAIAVLGPWLWLNPWLSIVLVVWALLSTIFFYGLSISAAAQYGDMIRSCFDLFRLDLMKQLQFARPDKLATERAQWEKISQVVVYGAEIDLPLAAQSGTDGDE